MELIDCVNGEIADVAMVAELRCGHDVWTAAQHERNGPGFTEDPVAGSRVCPLATEDSREPLSGSIEIVDREHGIGAGDVHA
jgi:hypothetical protein